MAATDTGSRKRWLAQAAGLGVLAIAKLAFAAQCEIYLSSGDNLIYVFLADHGYWGAPFLPDRAPGASLLMALGEAAGVRFRLLGELLLLAGTAASAVTLAALGCNVLAILAASALIVFAPIVNYHLDFAMTDGIQASLTLWLFAAGAGLVLARSARTRGWCALATGACAAMMMQVRPEGALIGAFIVPLAAMTGWRAWRGGKRGMRAIAVMLALLAAPGIMTTATVVALNTASFGTRSQASLLSPAETRLISALMRIDEGRSGRYVPITQAAREAAYAASPLLADRRASLEDPLSLRYAEDYTGIPGSLDTQRYLVLLKALDGRARMPGLFSDVRTSGSLREAVAEHEDALNAIAAELEAALADGRLKSRRILHPLLDPVVGAWLPDLPAAMLRMATHLVAAPLPWVDHQGYGFSMTEKFRHDRVLNRDGRRLAKGGLSGTLETGDAAVSQAWLTLQGTFFGEVAGGRQQRLAALTLEPQGHGYRIASPVLDERWLALALGIEVTFADGLTSVSPGLVTGAQQAIAASGGAPAWSYTIERFEPVIPPAQARVYGIWNTTAGAWPYLLAGLAAASIALALPGAAARRGDGRTSALAAILAATVFALAARLGYYAIIDVAAWHSDMRYIVPGLPLLALAMVLAGQLIAVQFARRPR